MSDAVISYTDEDTGLVFQWHGGAYIDVGYVGQDEEEYNNGDLGSFHATDVINVWNDELDESWLESEVAAAKMAGAYIRRPFREVLERFESRCDVYLGQLATEDADA